MFSESTRDRYILCSASVFKIKLDIFLDTLVQNRFLKIMKVNDLQGDQTGISTKIAPLILCIYELLRRGYILHAHCFGEPALSSKTIDLTYVFRKEEEPVKIFSKLN